MGPQGMLELGRSIICRNAYAKQCLAKLPSVRILHSTQTHFKEFVVNFDQSGRTVHAINRALLDFGIYGGHDLSHDFPELGQSALYSFTEVHSQADVASLCGALATILKDK